MHDFLYANFLFIQMEMAQRRYLPLMGVGDAKSTFICLLLHLVIISRDQVEAFLFSLARYMSAYGLN